MAELRSFDRVADVYDETRALPPEVARAAGERIAAIARETSAQPRVLEVGAGTGRIAVPAAEAGARVAGIDIAPLMLARLRAKRRDIDVMLAEASRPPLRDGTFDALLFVHILHLVPDAEAVLRATLPLVRPGGAVIAGEDDASRSVREQADLAVRRAASELAGIDMSMWERRERAAAAAERALAAAGASVRRETVVRWTARARGRTFLERLARRDYSSAWLIPEAVMPALLERVTPELEALYGGLDREIAYERSFVVMVGRLPG